MQNNTIVAQATPVGPGAIALIRLSGKDAISIAENASQLLGGIVLSQKKSHTISYGAIVDSVGQKIDQVLFLLMRAPNSFTGEDVVEITCHNNQLIIHAIITRCIELGAQPAERGEFTRRAVEHGKISLLQAEAIQELISSQSTSSIQKSLAQLEGSLSAWIEKLEKNLLNARALCEASFEFLEEEYDPESDLQELLAETRFLLLEAHEQFSAQKQLKEGIRIALIGATNAGKSSLLNALCKQDRAIVTPIAGTTRDTIETTLYKNGIAWTLVDTAGLRNTQDPIEAAGIQRTYKEAQKADIILLLVDGTSKTTTNELSEYQSFLKEHQGKCIILQTKADLQKNKVSALPIDLFVSSNQNLGLAELESKITEHLQNLLGQTELPFTLNQRHMHVLTQIQQIVEDVQGDLCAAQPSYELISLKLQDAIKACVQMSGKEYTAALLDTVFSQFCVGK